VGLDWEDLESRVVAELGGQPALCGGSGCTRNAAPAVAVALPSGPFLAGQG